MHNDQRYAYHKVIIMKMKLHPYTILHRLVNYDSLTVYDGDSKSANMLRKLTGDTRPDPILSTGSNVFIHFVDDSSDRRDGFHIRYEAVGKEHTYSMFMSLL